MQYALLIYEVPEAFSERARGEDAVDHFGAWRAYYRAVVEAGIYLGGKPLEVPETGTTVRHRNGKRQIQDGFILLELPTLDAALEWAARCPAASYGAVEVRPLASHVLDRVTGEQPG